jgi:adenylate kinase
MKLFKDKIAVMIMGAPGSGKGTQAELLSKKLDLFHFDTGRFLRKTLYSAESKGNKEIQKERKLNESGKLNTPAWVLKIVSDRVKEISKLGQSVIFSGSPRTEFEAFGDKKNKGLMEVLEKEYGKKNMFVFSMDVSESESIKRNKKRMSCSACGTPIMSGEKKQVLCPFCGGKLEARKDDNEETVKLRLREYESRTAPVLAGLKKNGYRVVKIDGRPLPYKIHERIYSYFR